MKDLLPCQGDFHRPLELARRDCRQNGVGVDPELAAETATDEGADQPHILNRHLQGCRDDLLSLIEHLVCGVEDQPVAVPHCKCGMGLHHGVALQRRGVGHVDLDGRTGERARKITNRTVSGRRIVRVGDTRLIEVLAKRVFSTRPVVFHLDQVGGSSGLLKTFGDDECNRLTVICHFRSRQHRMSLPVIAGALCGGVTVGEHENHARRVFCSARIDRSDRSLSDRGFDHEAVERVPLLLYFIRIDRGACDF